MTKTYISDFQQNKCQIISLKHWYSVYQENNTIYFSNEENQC